MNKLYYIPILVILALISISFASAIAINYTQNIIPSASTCTPTLGTYSRSQGVQAYNSTFKYLMGVAINVSTRTGTPSGIEIHVTNSSGGLPVYAQSYTSKNVTDGSISVPSKVYFYFNAPYPLLNVGTQYVLGIDSLSGTENYKLCYGGSTYGNGTAGYDLYVDRYNAGTWTSEAFDFEMSLIFSNETGLSAVNNVTVTATDSYDGSTITNFTVELNGTNYTTTSGSITTNLLTNTTTLHSARFFNANNSLGAYFNKTVTNQNVSGGLVTTTLPQTDIKVLGYSKIVVGNVVGTIHNSSGANLGATNTSIYFKAGTYNLTFFNNTWYNKTQEFTFTALQNTTVNISSLYDQVQNYTAKQVINNTAINNYNITITTTTGYTENQTTTNGTYQKYAKEFRTYKISKGRKIPLQDTLIQRARFSLGTKAEVKAIQMARKGVNI